jgi:hypothetical protein
MVVRFEVGDPDGAGAAYLSTLESGPRSVLNDKALFSINLKKGTTNAEAKSGPA